MKRIIDCIILFFAAIGFGVTVLVIAGEFFSGPNLISKKEEDDDNPDEWDYIKLDRELESW